MIERGPLYGCSYPDALILKLLGLGVQYFLNTVDRLKEVGSVAVFRVIPAAAYVTG